MVKNNVYISEKQNSSPLVAVQGRSQQHQPPEVIKEAPDKTHKAHLTVGNKCRFVEKPVVPDPVPCFNKFVLLSNYVENFCDYDSLIYVNGYLADNVCSFAAQGTGGDELVQDID